MKSATEQQLEAMEAVASNEDAKRAADKRRAAAGLDREQSREAPPKGRRTKPAVE